MRITQGTFSFLPDLTDEQITRQVQYCLDNGWAVNIEFTDDPHPRNTYWDMWELPMFDLREAAGVTHVELRSDEAAPALAATFDPDVIDLEAMVAIVAEALRAHPDRLYTRELQVCYPDACQ